ncbi:hypothetical protein B7463_g9340, partial [Scytalidium lignicola]
MPSTYKSRYLSWQERSDAPSITLELIGFSYQELVPLWGGRMPLPLGGGRATAEDAEPDYAAPFPVASLPMASSQSIALLMHRDSQRPEAPPSTNMVREKEPPGANNFAETLNDHQNMLTTGTFGGYSGSWEAKIDPFLGND